MKDKSKYKTTKRTKYEWGFYANSFLGLAKIGCFELLEEKYKNHYPRSSELLYSDDETHAAHLLIAIFFNLRHGLELHIKTVGIILDGNYLKKHDINYLLQDFEQRVTSITDLSDAQNVRIISNIEAAKRIITKYFTWNLFEYAKKQPFVDTQNELFRYPESDSIISEFSNFFEPTRESLFEEFRKFRIKKLEDIVDDINDISRIFTLLHAK